MRNSQQEADGIVGEVVFPNTVPPFFPSFVLFAKPADRRRVRAPPRRRAGPQPLAEGLVRRVPRAPRRRRPDLPQRHRRHDRRHPLDQGERLRGGILLPNIPPNSKSVEAALRPRATTGCGRSARTSRSRSTSTAARATPTTGPTRCRCCSTSPRRCSTRSARSCSMLLSGVFERFPRLKFVMTEQGCAWVPALLERLDEMLEGIRIDRRHRRDPLRRRARPAAVGHRVLPPELLDGREPARRRRRRRPRPHRPRPVHVGQRLPARRGHAPVHPRAPARAGFSDVDPTIVRKLLSENAAKLYGFDLDALAPAGRQGRPDGRRGRPPIDDVPDKTLERLSGDMDPKAIK